MYATDDSKILAFCNNSWYECSLKLDEMSKQRFRKLSKKRVIYVVTFFATFIFLTMYIIISSQAKASQRTSCFNIDDWKADRLHTKLAKILRENQNKPCNGTNEVFYPYLHFGMGSAIHTW